MFVYLFILLKIKKPYDKALIKCNQLSFTPVIRKAMRPLVLLALFQLYRVFSVTASVVTDSSELPPAIINLDRADNSDSEVEITGSMNPIYNTPVSVQSPVQEVAEFGNESDFEDRRISVVGNSQIEEEEESFLSLFPHTVGIRNHAYNCYASALISCLYNIPVVQMALYEEVSRSDLRKDESVVTALATIFYKMRHGKSFIDLESFFVPAIRKSLGWEFGNIECVLEFWNQISETLPESLFQIELQENRFRKSDQVLIKSDIQKSNLILVSPSKNYRNIEEILRDNFADEEAEDFIVEPKEIKDYPHLFGEGATSEVKISVPSRTTLTIKSCPKVLIFGVKRVRWNATTGTQEFDSTPLGFPEKLLINEEKYTIVGNVEYNEERVHYFAQNHDLWDDQWYIHDDKAVTRIPDTEEAFDDLTMRFIHNSSMVFYVKGSLLEEFGTKESVEIPSDVITKLTIRSKRQNSTPELSGRVKRKRGGEDKVFEEQELTVTEEIVESQESAEIVEEPVKSEVKKVRKPYKKREKNSRVKTTFFETRFGPMADFRLGTTPFLFHQDNRNSVLEPILMAFAAHPKAVRKLFESARYKTSADFEFKFALTVLSILTGNMAVQTVELSQILVERHGIYFGDIGSAWKRISSLLSQEISPLPNLKVITYKDDEPMSLENINNCDSFALSPFNLMPCPRELKFSGAAFNLVENRSERIMKLNILKSDEGLIIPLPVDRIIKHPEELDGLGFNTNPVQMNLGPYLIYGFITINPNTGNKQAVLSDQGNRNRYFIYSAGTPGYMEKSTELQERVLGLLRHQSVLVLLSKPDDFYSEMPMLSDVPDNLISELIASKL